MNVVFIFFPPFFLKFSISFSFFLYYYFEIKYLESIESRSSQKIDWFWKKCKIKIKNCSQIFYLTCCSDIAKVWKLVLIHLNYIDFSSIEITCSYIIYYILHYRVNHNQASCNMGSIQFITPKVRNSHLVPWEN